jgi:hypothetical protein
MRKKQIKHSEVQAVMVSSETLEIAAEWCGGDIKGIKLPRSQRGIRLFSKLRQTELRAENGDFIVEVAPGVFEVLPPKIFHAMYVDVDPTPW